MTLEASSRVLVDRSVLRVDGRPFFTFGPRVLLSPADSYPQLLKDIASLGFTTVGSPPCSPGTIDLLNKFFDAAEAAGLMVVLLADPRLPEHGQYMAANFRHRRSLHSYVLPISGHEAEALEIYRRTRESLFNHDLFHPIWASLPESLWQESWIKVQDIYSAASDGKDAGGGRVLHQRPGHHLTSMLKVARRVASRPSICTDLRVFTSDQERALGLYSDDSWISRLPDRSLDWFPYLANFARIPRRDFLAPDPEMLRLQFYGLLAAGARGVLLNFHEGMLGPAPYTGRDRLSEAAILAQEVAIFHDFFAEGRHADLEVDSGHPRLSATPIRHGLETLLVLRLEGYEEDYFVDEAYLERTEISVRAEEGAGLKAWRVDFPEARPLEIMRDSTGAMRFLAGPLELTGLVLLTPGNQRSEDLADGLRERLPFVARLAVDELAFRFAKIALVEGELRLLNAGIDNEERLRAVQKGLEEAHALLRREAFAEAYQRARQMGRYLRQIIKYQMARSLSTPVFERASIRVHLRSNYYLLPRFYREGAMESARAFTDLT